MPLNARKFRKSLRELFIAFCAMCMHGAYVYICRRVCGYGVASIQPAPPATLHALAGARLFFCTPHFSHFLAIFNRGDLIHEYLSNLNYFIILGIASDWINAIVTHFLYLTKRRVQQRGSNLRHKNQLHSTVSRLTHSATRRWQEFRRSCYIIFTIQRKISLHSCCASLSVIKG